MNIPKIVDILLAEDDPNDAELALIALKKVKGSSHIVIVEDGAEVLDFLFSKGKYSGTSNTLLPKVIFLDLKLPKINGLEVLKVIKQDPRTQYIPVVMITSSTEHADIQNAYGFRANSYIVKPVNFEEYQKAVSLAGEYWLEINQPHI